MAQELSIANTTTWSILKKKETSGVLSHIHKTSIVPGCVSVQKKMSCETSETILWANETKIDLYQSGKV